MMPVFSNLKQLKYFLVFVGVALLMFDISYYLMSVLPGSRDYMCIEGANLTPLNISFSLLLSVMVGILVVGFISLFVQNYAKKKATLTSMSGVGFIAGTMSLICPACALPVIPLLGASTWLNFVSEYEVLFKILSFGLKF